MTSLNLKSGYELGNNPNNPHWRRAKAHVLSFFCFSNRRFKACNAKARDKFLLQSVANFNLYCRKSLNFLVPRFYSRYCYLKLCVNMCACKSSSISLYFTLLYKHRFLYTFICKDGLLSGMKNIWIVFMNKTRTMFRFVLYFSIIKSVSKPHTRTLFIRGMYE